MRAVYLEEGAVNQHDISMAPISDVVETTFFENTTEDNKFEHIGDSEIVFTNKVIFDEETFSKLPNLKYIGVCATGYNVIDLDAARRHNVVVTNVPAYSTESVAQLTWGLIIESVSHIGKHSESVKRGEWVKSEVFCYWIDTMGELAGKTIGIIGYGNIGSRVAEIALAFNMNVLVYTAHPDKYKTADSRIKFVSFYDLLAQSDIVSLHCPMSNETDRLIRRENIDKMKDGVIIINVSRGGLVDEKDLAEALESGKVSAAACDVVSVEPMRADNPLLKAKNITITPHVAWASREARIRLIDTVASNVRAYLDGQKLNVVS
ncbi:MAG: D-2-hydroxyacid dehydrogenase [Lachnospiraceae bacterium]|nr:D-2-hydroxyacid dehydrogenase [Lachnospiraceae bacterium]MBP5564146.1 D-2-hydroxyacid dehydrogenase [Lachnospiraceae bacterium]